MRHKKSYYKTIYSRREQHKVPRDFQSSTLLTCPRQLAWPDKFFLAITVRFGSGHTFSTKYICIQAVYTHGYIYNRGRNIWRFTYLFQHNEFHAWSAANHAKVITGTQITGGSCVKMNVSADLLRRLPTESMTRLCHVVADVKLKNKKKRERKRKKRRKK